jgi:hypothetical protein
MRGYLAGNVAGERRGALLLTLSAGRVIREQDFLDYAEAFQAAGLEPPPTRSF